MFGCCGVWLLTDGFVSTYPEAPVLSYHKLHTQHAMKEVDSLHLLCKFHLFRKWKRQMWTCLLSLGSTSTLTVFVRNNTDHIFRVCDGRWCRAEYKSFVINGEALREDKLRAKLCGFLLKELFSGFPRINMSPRRDMGSLQCVGLTALLLCTGRTPAKCQWRRVFLQLNKQGYGEKLTHKRNCKCTNLWVISFSAQHLMKCKWFPFSQEDIYNLWDIQLAVSCCDRIQKDL